MPTPVSLLYDLLSSLFSGDEVRRWVEYDDELALLASTLPGGSASPALILSETIRGIRRHGLVSEQFFGRLDLK